jgi:hypothetical protein
MAGHPFTNLSPADAAVALRSFGRRFRDAASAAATTLDEEPDEDQIDEVANRTGADGRSAIDHVAEATTRLAAVHDSVRAALVNPNHRVDARLVATDPGEPSHAAGGLHPGIDALERAASALAHQVDHADASNWLASRTTTDGGTATPLQVLQAAVAFTLDRLRDTERTLREVRGRP